MPMGRGRTVRGVSGCTGVYWGRYVSMDRGVLGCTGVYWVYFVYRLRKF